MGFLQLYIKKNLKKILQIYLHVSVVQMFVFFIYI